MIRSVGLHKLFEMLEWKGMSHYSLEVQTGNFVSQLLVLWTTGFVIVESV
jgi:hypothetical protein